MAEDIKRKIYAAKINNIDEENHTVKVLVSDWSVDRDFERMAPGAWKKRLKHYKAHPVLLVSHAMGGSLENQIGKALTTWEDEAGLHAELKYFAGEGNKEADWGWFLVKNKIAAYSVGFRSFKDTPGDADGNNEEARTIFRDNELLDISHVLIGSNRNTVVKGLESQEPIIKTLTEKKQKEFPDTFLEYEAKTVIPYKKYPLIDEARAWSASKAELNIRKWAGWDGESTDSIDFKKYQSAFSWVDSDNPEALASYKLPHHDVDGGVVGTHWRGTVAAMTALLGGRGGTNIPDGDRRGIYNHLAKHYKDFDKEVPEFKAYATYQDILSGCKDVETAIELSKINDDMLFVKRQHSDIIDTIDKHLASKDSKICEMDAQQLIEQIVKGITKHIKSINSKPSATQEEGVGEEYIGQLLKGVEATNKVLSG